MINSLICIPFIISCSNNNNIDNNLKTMYKEWYNSLTNSPWNKDKNGNFINYYCQSEQQAIALYANFRGWFYNESLHQNKEPENQMVKIYLGSIKEAKEIRGSDYKLISNALQKATSPIDITVYHGVEYMEIEFWDQLKDYIVKTDDGSYDYSKCIGKEITSYGFISTSLSKNEAIEYSNGIIFNNDKPWDQLDEFYLPLKEKVVFEISIKKEYKGAAYLADFDFAGTINNDNQILIDRNCKFRINEVSKEKDVNIFKVDLIQY